MEQLIKLKNSMKFGHLLAILFFFLISLIIYLPWILMPNSVVIAIPGDSLASVWEMWRTGVAMKSGQPLNFTKLIAAPYGFSYVVSSLFWSKLQLLFRLFFNEVFTYNFLNFASFPLAAMTMYLLAWHITRSRLASFVAGFIFAFSPYHLMRSLGHLTLAHIQWLPLFFLSLIKFHEKKSLTNLFLLVGSFSLIVLFDFYYGYFSFLIAIPLGLLIFFYNRRNLHDKVFQTKNINYRGIRYVFLAVISLVVLSVTIYPIISNLVRIIAVYGRPIDELYTYSARPLEYLTPSINNPFFGKFVEKFSSSRLHGSNFTEQTLYLGFVPLILAITALFAKSNNPRKRFVIYFSLVGIFSALLFSAPPFIHIFSINLPMPSYFSYKFMPVFRVYARFGIFVMMFVALLAGIGLKSLLERIDSNRVKLLLVMMIFSLIAMEFSNIPPVIDVSAKSAPKVYHWIANQPGDFIVAEYPWASSAEYSNSEYLFYQRIHKKRLANGAAEGSYADKVRQNLVNLEDYDIGIKLRRLGVKYIVVHREKYKEGMPNQIKRYYGGLSPQIKYNFTKIPNITTNNIRLVKRFGDDYVYIVEAVNSGTMSTWGKNVYSTEFFSNSKWRWMSNKGELVVTNYNKKPIIANINIDTFSFNKPRILGVILGSKLLKRSLIGIKPRAFVIEKVKLQPGVNRLTFEANPGADIADSKLHNGDRRKLSICFGKLTIKEISR